MRSAIWVMVMGGSAMAAGIVGCQSEKAKAGAPAAFATADQQIAYGGKVFSNRCASCHGDGGQGTSKAPALVGPGALPKSPRPEAKFRKTEFRTAMDVAGFVTQNMPPKAEVRKQMTEQDYWAVLAFALSANGAKPATPVGPGNAGSIVLHP